MMNSEFLLTSLIVVLIPGTGVIYTVSNGLFMGKKASIAAAVGCTLGIVPHLTASILGLSAILHMSAVAFQIIKYVGAIYLLYLAWFMWRETGGMSFDASGSKSSYFQVVLKGFLINILNPKLSIFFLAFLPLFVSETATSPLLQMILMSVVFMLMTFVVFVIYGLFSNGFRRYVMQSPKVIVRVQRSFAAIFAVLGIKLAMTER